MRPMRPMRPTRPTIPMKSPRSLIHLIARRYTRHPVLLTLLGVFLLALLGGSLMARSVAGLAETGTVVPDGGNLAGNVNSTATSGVRGTPLLGLGSWQSKGPWAAAPTQVTRPSTRRLRVTLQVTNGQAQLATLQPHEWTLNGVVASAAPVMLPAGSTATMTLEFSGTWTPPLILAWGDDHWALPTP